MFHNLQQFEHSTHSQNGEDGVIARLLSLVGVDGRYFVEFGVGHEARECNTRLLRELGWEGLWLDCKPSGSEPRINKARVTAENINELFEEYQVPCNLDLLSIDIDGNDYWVWKALDPKYSPRIVVAEYNAIVPPTESKSIAYDPGFRWANTDYFGASLLALTRLAKRRGYTLVYCDTAGVNAFFVRADLAGDWKASVAELYRPPNYCRGRLRERILPKFVSRLLRRREGHRPDPVRRLIEVE